MTIVDEKEKEVCNILLNLGTLIHQSEANLKSPFSWGARKRRSNKDGTYVSPSPHHRQLLVTPTTISQNDELLKKHQDKVEASSPATPLSFSPSESDDKSKHSFSKKNSKKRPREELLEKIKELTNSREVLRGEVENVRSYYNKLKAFNMELNAVKHERLTASVRQPLPHNVGINLNQHYRISIMPYQQQQQEEFQFSYGKVNDVGPRGIPDLNVFPEEAFGVEPSQPLDYTQTPGERKAMAAEKRMIRRMINIKKKTDQRSR